MIKATSRPMSTPLPMRRPGATSLPGERRFSRLGRKGGQGQAEGQPKMTREAVTGQGRDERAFGCEGGEDGRRRTRPGGDHVGSPKPRSRNLSKGTPADKPHRISAASDFPSCQERQLTRCLPLHPLKHQSTTCSSLNPQVSPQSRTRARPRLVRGAPRRP